MPDPRIVGLAQRYPKGCELTQTTRIGVYYAIGTLLPRATKAGSRRTAYGKNPVNAFLADWEAAGGMTLSSSVLKLCRQVYGGYTAQQITDAIQSKIPWTALRDLCQTRVPQPLRDRLLAELCRGDLKPSEVPARVDEERGGTPRKGRLPLDRVAALKRIHGDVVKLQKALEGSAGLLEEALAADGPPAKVVIAAVTMGLRACLVQWRRELKSARRRRDPEAPGPAGGPPPR
jgi:hypothetical protein